jgi:DNA repair exonuclease SbcCD ATPase subunit
VAGLLHDYDAVKRREYYLRTRKLIGRTKKATPSAVAKRSATKTPPAKTHAQRQKELEARVARLQAKFARLQVALKAMVEAAQKRSGVKKNASETVAESKYQSKKSSTDPTSKYEKKTQKQKDVAAEAAAKYRDKNQVLTDQVTDLNNKIKAIRERMKRLQKTGSVGASNSTTK